MLEAAEKWPPGDASVVPDRPRDWSTLCQRQMSATAIAVVGVLLENPLNVPTLSLICSRLRRVFAKSAVNAFTPTLGAPSLCEADAIHHPIMSNPRSS